MISEKTVSPGPRHGTAAIPSSKSEAHRLMILSALSDNSVTLACSGFSNDIIATADCLNAMGASILLDKKIGIVVDPCRNSSGRPEPPNRDTSGRVVPTRRDTLERPVSLHPDTPGRLIQTIPDTSGRPLLPCRDSGSTLRFLMPLCGALGISACFEMSGRLPERPLAPFDEELEKHGMKLTKVRNRLYVEGRLNPGVYSLPGNVSSQYISGLLMSLPSLYGDSRLTITGNIESADYIRMTTNALTVAGIDYSREDRTFLIPGRQHYHMPDTYTIGGDWSGAAFFLCLGALSPEGILVRGLDPDSKQGDKAILDVLKLFGANIDISAEGIFVKKGPLHGITLDASGIPDLVPVISVIAAAAVGTTHIVNAGRLRLKESDRLKSTAALISGLGGMIVEEEDSLTIKGTGRLHGGRADSFSDHRIAMSAAVASAICSNPVIISDPDCVRKSFSDFWQVFDNLDKQ